MYTVSVTRRNGKANGTAAADGWAILVTQIQALVRQLSGQTIPDAKHASGEAATQLSNTDHNAAGVRGPRQPGSCLVA